MNLDHQPIGADGDGGSAQRRNQTPLAGGVGGIEYNRQMSQFIQDRHGSYVERVARRGFKSPDAALA